MNGKPQNLHGRLQTAVEPAVPLPQFVAIDLPVPLAQALAGKRAVVQLEYGDLNKERLHSLGDTILACPLIGPKVDATAIVERLAALEYRGSLIVVSPRLPKPSLVEGELRGAARGFVVNLVTL